MISRSSRLMMRGERGGSECVPARHSHYFSSGESCVEKVDSVRPCGGGGG